MSTPIKITREEYEKKFGKISATPVSAPIKITRAEYEKKFTPIKKKGIVEEIASTPYEVGKGILKGGASTIQGMANLGEKVLANTVGKGINAITGKNVRPEIAQMPSSWTTPEGTRQKVGFGAEQLAEFFIPAGASSKLVKAGEAGTRILGMGSKATGLANLATRATVGAGEMAGVTALQTGGDKEATKQSAIFGAVAPVATTALKIGADYYKTRKLANALTKNIDYSIEKAVRPTVVGKSTFQQKQGYLNKARNAVVSVVENKQNLKYSDDAGNLIEGQVPKTLNQFSQAIEQTKKSIFDKYNSLATQAGQKGAEVDLSPIAKELDQVINNKALQLTHPESIKYAQEVQARYLGTGKIDSETTQQVIQNYNNALNSFYKNPSYETASKVSIDAMVVNNLRKSLDDIIEKTEGVGYQDLKNQYGALKTIEKDVAHRAIVEGRKNIKGLLDFTDVFSGSQLAQGLLTMNPSAVTSGLASKAIASYYKYINSPDRIISNMFGQAEKSITTQLLKERGNIGTVLLGSNKSPKIPKVNVSPTQKPFETTSKNLPKFITEPYSKTKSSLPISSTTGGKGAPFTTSMSETSRTGIETKGILPKAKTENPLIQEAKKYKTAEEFVKAQESKKLFHGTQQDFDTFDVSKGHDFEGKRNNTGWGKGVLSFTKSERNASAYTLDRPKIYSGGKPQVKEAYVDLKNPFVIGEYGDIGRKGQNYGAYQKARDGFGKYGKIPAKNNARMEAFVKDLKAEGYDGIIMQSENGPGEYVAFSNDQIKTKSQLTDIWNKAHKTKILKDN